VKYRILLTSAQAECHILVDMHRTEEPSSSPPDQRTRTEGVSDTPEHLGIANG
jgi:hypothetical protein